MTSATKKIFLGKEILGEIAGFLTFIDRYSLLIQCCEDGSASSNTALIAMCVDDIQSYSSKDEEKNTMLICAVNEGRVSIVQALSTLPGLNLNLDVQNANDNTALYRVAVLGQSITAKSKISSHQVLNMASALVNGGADLNIKGANDFTPLMWAAYTGNIDLITLFTEHGANGDVQDKNGWTPLMHAVTHNHKEVCKILIEKSGCNVDIRWKDGSSALLMAIQGDKTEIAKMLIDAKSDLSIQTHSNGYNAVLYCTYHGRTEILDYLFQQKEEGVILDLYLEVRDMAGMCALHRAVAKDESLTAANEVANLFSGNIAAATATHQQTQGTEPVDPTGGLIGLLTAGLASLNVKDTTPVASEMSILSKMVAGGCDVNVTTTDGRTALMVAIQQKQWNSVEALLECEDIDVRVQDGIEGKDAFDYLEAADEIETKTMLRIMVKMKYRGGGKGI